MAQTDDLKKDEINTGLVTIIKGYLPFLSFLAFIYGIINQGVYYSGFNINILEYTDFNELLLAALLPFVLIMIYAAAVAMYYWITIKKVIKHPEPTSQPIAFILIMTYVFTAIPLLYYCLLFDLWNSYSKWSLLIFTVLSVLLIILIYKFDVWYAIASKSMPPPELLTLIVIFFTAINFSLCSGIFQIGKIKYHPETGNSIVIGNKTINSTNSYFQIGRTTNYTFFYNPKNDQTAIFPNKDISRILIKPE